MWIHKFIRCSLALLALCVASIPAQAQRDEATAILEESAQAMGGLQALRGLTTEVLEGSVQQFEPEQGLRSGGAARHVADFRYTLTRQSDEPRLRLEWNARVFYPRQGAVQFIEIIDGEHGLLQETTEEGGASSTTRMHPGRQASRLPRRKASAQQDFAYRASEREPNATPRFRFGGDCPTRIVV